MDDNLWLLELEAALMEDCNVNELYTICRGKTIPDALRPDVWQLCLDVRHKPDQIVMFNEIFDLPFQSDLRHDCDMIVDKLGNDDDERVSVASDLESILTFYCKSRQFKFEKDNGWTEILLPLLSLKLSRSYTYNMFEAIRDTYIPHGCERNGIVFHVFRLLILYHDPELCSLLDTKKISADAYALSWFRSLFAVTCSFEVVLAMWDQYFQHSDPFLVFFLALIMLINGRERILEMSNQSQETIIAFLKQMPCALEPADVVDFCALAQYYSLKTPVSFKTDYQNVMFGISSGYNDENGVFVSDHPTDSEISQALCLPVSVYELIENASSDIPHPDAVRFFLVDCRPAEQYNNGHLSTAFHLDSNLMLQEPNAFATAVQGLLRSQRLAIEVNSCAGGEHLCFMGSGRLDEDQYMHMAVASFLQKNTQFVSLLTGGYNAIHEYFGENMADCLEDHDPRACLVCCNYRQNTFDNNNPDSQDVPGFSVSGDDFNDNKQHQHHSQNDALQRSSTYKAAGATSTRSSSDLFSKWSAVMKTKSAEVKGKLLDYIVNQHGPSGHSSVGNTAIRQSLEESANNIGNDREPYSNMTSVFSIDEDQDDAVNSDLSGSQISSPKSTVYRSNVTDISNTTTSLTADVREIVQLEQILRSDDLIKSFKCQEVHMNGYMYESHLIVTGTNLLVVREIGRDGEAQVIVRRPLSSIVKITAKKRQRDLITFKYGVTNGDTLVVTDMDRFLIPNAAAATALVSQEIIRQLETSDKCTIDNSDVCENGTDGLPNSSV